MMAQTAPSVHMQDSSSLLVPAMARGGSPRRSTAPLKYGERHDMLIEANRAARRGIPVNGQVIHPMAVSVLLELDEHYNMQEGVSRPSRERIAANLGVTDLAAISRAISELVKAGFIIREQRGRRTIYRFRGPLFSHHLAANVSLAADTDDLLNSGTGDTGVTGNTVGSDTLQSANSVTHDTPMVSPVPLPNKNPVLEPGGTPNPLSDPPSSSSSSCPEQPRKRDKVKELFDRCDELGVKRPHLRGQDTRALRLSDAEPSLVAEAWAAAWSQRWQDEWVQKTMTIQVILDKLAVYERWLERGQSVNRRGPSNGGRSYEEMLQRGAFDGYFDPPFRGIGCINNDPEHMRQKYREAYGVSYEEDPHRWKQNRHQEG